MAERSLTTPYSTVKPLIRGEALWIPEDDRERIAAYGVYEDIYWNIPDTFKLIQRGGDSPPIYVPNARTICDVTSHYLLKGLEITLEDPESQPDLAAALSAFLKRERFYSRFHTAKLSGGVVKGDFILHLTADSLLPASRRISLTPVTPESYFPVFDEDDVDKRVAVHLAEQILVDNEVRVKRLTYRQVTVDGRRRVTREEAIYPLDEWDAPDPDPVQVTLDPMLLPAEIDVIPVYHFRNIGWTGRPYGTSELAGFERLLGAVNQSISDVDVALALEGLGVYVTDSGKPVDEDGQEREWEIAPGHVIQLSGTYFKRVEGINDIGPMREFVEYLEARAMESAGLSDVALGKVDTAIAESGIALAIRFSPTMAKIEQRDREGVDTLQNLFFDWKKWWRAYEGTDFGETEILAKLGEKLPFNRTAILNELNNMLDRKVISRAFYRREMIKLGYKFPEDIAEEIVEEEKALGEAAVDPFATRIENDANNLGRPNESAGTEATQTPEEQAR